MPTIKVHLTSFQLESFKFFDILKKLLTPLLLWHKNERMNDILISNEENNNDYVIYKVENLMNGQVYIGATTKSLNTRKKEHLRDVKRATATRLHQSIATFGANSFKWETIDTANTLNDLAQKEKEYIIKYDSKDNGLNIDSGGGFKKKVYQFDKQSKKLISVFGNLNEAAYSVDSDKQHISSACLSVNGDFKGYYWGYSYSEYYVVKKDSRRKIVIQYDLNNDAIQEFISVSEASKSTGLNKNSIAKVCRNERLRCGGFLWKYKNID